jgi:hypothetical protein
MFPPTAPWWSAGLYDAAGQLRAFRWTASGGMEDLNTTYASLLTNGSCASGKRAPSPPMGAILWEHGYNAATGRDEAFLLDTGFPLRGDVDHNGSVDDADLLAVLFAFGGRATATKTSTGMVSSTTRTC